MPSDEPDAAVYDRAPGDVEVPSPPQNAEFPADDAEYGYWDPKANTVQPLPGPAPSSDAPGNVGGTSEQTESFPFDERWLKEFEGLLFVGALTSKFTWLGHEFLIRTLKTDEIIQAGLLIKDLAGTMGYDKAYQAAVLAGSVMQVDGRELPIPITTAPDDTVMQNRYDYIRRTWFPPVIDHVYDRYIITEMKVREVIDAMGKALG